ncbi:MAG: hypothetical protein IJX92_06590 [Clostridia bacterium]|nr:hypothetical protein [Clostridia bacterium]
MESWFFALLATRKKLEKKEPFEAPDWISEPSLVSSLVMFTELSRDPRVSGRFAQLQSHVERVCELSGDMLPGVEPSTPNYWFLLGYNLALKSVSAVADELKKGG